jgi:cell division protein FtsL
MSEAASITDFEIALIVIGVALVLVLVMYIVINVCRKKNTKQKVVVSPDKIHSAKTSNPD